MTTYERRQAAGLCKRCGERPPRRPYKNCQICTDEINNIETLRYHRLRAAHKCVQCERGDTATKLCADCQQKYYASSKAGRKRARLKLRDDMLAAYGGCCACCGETRKEFLALDHKFNDGHIERKTTPGGTQAIWARLRRAGFPKERHQLLCHNCNCAKQFYGECPHVKEQQQTGRSGHPL